MRRCQFCGFVDSMGGLGHIPDSLVCRWAREDALRPVRAPRSPDDEAAVEALRDQLLARARWHGRTASVFRKRPQSEHYRLHAPRACIAIALALLL